MIPAPFITYAVTLLYLNREPDQVTDLEQRQIEHLIDASTSVIISYCGQDPRDDADQECSVLEFVAAKMIQKWFPTMADQTTGIDTESFADISIKFFADAGLDPLSKQILSRYRIFSIA